MLGVTEPDLRAIVALNEIANDCLRRGGRLEDARFLVLRKHIHDIRVSGVGGDLRIATVGALRRLADLADRAGKYQLSREVLEAHGNHVAVRQLLEDAERLGSDELLKELAWYEIVYSVTEHRQGRFEAARDRVLQLDRAIRFIKGEALELRCRRAYALARHCESMVAEGGDREAERFFTEALEYCARIPDLRYATYRSGVILTGMSRLYLSRGELERSMRLISVARINLRGSDDKVTAAYIDFLMGCVLRQRGDLCAALSALKGALAAFDKDHLSHARYYLRCRHELAKTYLNVSLLAQHEDIVKANSSLDDAIATLDRNDTTFEIHGPKPSSATRWEVKDRMLRTRIGFQRLLLGGARPGGGQLRELREGISNEMEVLQGGRDRDVRAIGRLIQAEISIALGELSLVEPSIVPITEGAFGPLDAADIGWAWLLIGESRFQNGSEAGALDALRSFRELRIPNQNIFFTLRERDLDARIRDRRSSGFSLVINGPSDIPVWDNLETELKGYLLDRASGLGLSKTQQKEAFGVDRKTLKGWYRDTGRPEPQ